MYSQEANSEKYSKSNLLPDWNAQVPEKIDREQSNEEICRDTNDGIGNRYLSFEHAGKFCCVSLGK